MKIKKYLKIFKKFNNFDFFLSTQSLKILQIQI